MKLMKVWFLVLCCTVAGSGLAQGYPSKVAHAVRTPAADMKTIYACPKCEMASMRSGKCPGCGTKMEKVNGAMMFACPKCRTEAKKPGNCPMCKVAMKPEIDTYACQAHQMSSKKPGMCPKCGAKMKAYHLPMMKPSSTKG